MLWLANMIIQSMNTETGKAPTPFATMLPVKATRAAHRCERCGGKGIPIGNVTSQLFANVYLNELDQFIKHELRVKHYIRYMDDFVILGGDKRELARMKQLISAFLQERLRLELHPKKSVVYPARKGIDFLGYTVYERSVFLRKDTVKRFVRRTRAYKKKVSRGEMEYERLVASAISWSAYAQYARSWRLRRDLEHRLHLPL